MTHIYGGIILSVAALIVAVGLCVIPYVDQTNGIILVGTFLVCSTIYITAD